jgi:hypothetical protein
MASEKELTLTRDRINEILDYREKVGKFYWLAKTSPKTNKIKIGSEAGNLQPDGYIRITIDGNAYAAHRVVWFLIQGSWPDGSIDHINGIRSDNRVENLRDVSRAVNQQNRTRPPRLDMSIPIGVRISLNKNKKEIGYRAYWQEYQGKKRSKHFSFHRHGSHKVALDAATHYRELMILQLNNNGAAYTDRHGK